jgi:uncharacterized phage protein (TIGR01671 family)
MTREICFRGKSISTGKWVEGDLMWHNPFLTKKTYIKSETIGPLDWSEVEPSSVGQFTGLLDKNGKRIFENMKMNCSWLGELGVTEFDCEAVGTVVYQPAIAAYVLEFDKPYRTSVNYGGSESGVYEVEQMQLREYDEDETISFEIIDPEFLDQ